MIYALIIFFAVLVVDLYTDLRLYKLGKKVDHTRGAILRTIALIPAVLLGGWLIAPVLFFGWIILFNGLYNLGIKKPWEYTGTTSKLDRLQAKLKWVKYAGLAVSIIIYVIYAKT